MNLSEQLKTPLTVMNGEKLPNVTRFVLGGMGGSRLPAEFFRAMFPALSVQVWKSYGLPPEAPKDALYIASSYSGNTREALSFFDEARKNGMNIVVIAGGGELLSRARAMSVPHIEIPWDKDTPARRIIPVALRALSLIITETNDAIRDGFTAAEHAGAYEHGALLSGSIPVQSIPLFFASEKNAIIAEYAKIEASETAHVPAYASVFPEFLHNELAGFARDGAHITPVFFFDPSDDERAIKDARHAMRFLEKKGYTPVSIDLKAGERHVLLAEAILTIQGLADALLRDRVPTPDFIREFRKEE